MTLRRRALVALGTLAVALGLAVGLGVQRAGSPDNVEPRPPTPAQAAPRHQARLPVPPALGWTACGQQLQCSTLVVPLDYSNPSGARIGIALARRPASDPARRIGSLVVNPGGPGESGVQNLDKDLGVLPAAVLDDFDVVSFDPRGVGASEGIRCSGAPYGGPAPAPVPQTSTAEQALLAADRSYAAACATGAGALLAHVGTEDVARDVEELRTALGDTSLDYLGLSYGTLIGLMYAAMFPTHVRAMVLDGPLDPSLSTIQLADNQALGFESALGSFFGWCESDPGRCGWRPAGDPHAVFGALASALAAHPLAVGGQTVGQNELYTGTFGALYATSFWPSLGRALAGVQSGDGAPMLGLFRAYQRSGDSSFDGDADNAITCLDHPVARDPSVYFGLAAQAAQVAPDFGPLFAWDTLACAVWPVPDSALRQPRAVRAAGSPPILVVGTTGDPATPYAWARAVASNLARGVLLTRVGTDHVAIFDSPCVRAWDQAYLVALRAPPTGTTCPS